MLLRIGIYVIFFLKDDNVSEIIVERYFCSIFYLSWFLINIFFFQNNNGLERFNRQLNDAFSVEHPTTVDFFSAIRQISREEWTKHDRNLRKKRKHQFVNLSFSLCYLRAVFDAFV